TRPVRGYRTGPDNRQTSGSAQRGQHAGSDLFDAADALDTGALGLAVGGGQLLVEVHQRLGLGVVDLQTLAYGLFLVVLTLDQLFTGHIVLAGLLRRIVFQVVGATGTAADDLLVVHGNFQNVIDLDACVHQCLGLGNGARKAVQQEAVGAIILSNTLVDQTNDQLVGDQAAGIHHFLDLLAQFGTGLDCGTQHVAGGDLRNIEPLADELGLCALARAGGTQ